MPADGMLVDDGECFKRKNAHVIPQRKRVPQYFHPDALTAQVVSE